MTDRQLIVAAPAYPLSLPPDSPRITCSAKAESSANDRVFREQPHPHGDPAVVSGYGPNIQPPSVSTDIMYGTAFVDGVDIKANQQGSITTIQDTTKGAFAANVAGDLSNADRNSTRERSRPRVALPRAMWVGILRPRGFLRRFAARISSRAKSALRMPLSWASAVIVTICRLGTAASASAFRFG